MVSYNFGSIAFCRVWRERKIPPGKSRHCVPTRDGRIWSRTLRSRVQITIQSPIGTATALQGHLRSKSISRNNEPIFTKATSSSAYPRYRLDAKVTIRPIGSYKIIQKDKDHASNLYGEYVDAAGNVIQKDVESGKDPKPPGASF